MAVDSTPNPPGAAPPKGRVRKDAQDDLLEKWARAQVRFAIARQALELTRNALMVLLLAASVIALILGMLSGDLQLTALLPRV